MFRTRRGAAPGKAAAGLMALLLSAGLSLLPTGCQDLNSSSESTAPESSVTTTLQDDATDLTPLFGNWQGEYTPEVAWDEDGRVDDPPFELGSPVETRVELHPFDSSTADFGSMSGEGFTPARVTSLTRDGDQVMMVIASEASGLADLIGVFLLTLDGDILSGVDDGEPAVPEGWTASSGTIELTRTAAWDPATSTETTEAAGGAGPAGDDADADADDDADDGGVAPGGGAIPLLPREPLDPIPMPPALSLDAGDEGRSGTIRVGDTVEVFLEFPEAEGVTVVSWTSTATSLLFNSGGNFIRDWDTGIYTEATGFFRALAPGRVGVICLSRRADGSLYDMWQYYLLIED